MKPLAVLAGLLILAAPASSGAASPRTLAVIDAPVVAFAQNGRFAAWIATGPKDRCGAVVVQDLRTQKRRAVAGGGCTGLVLAGDRVLWEDSGGSNLTEWTKLLSASHGSRRRVVDYQSIAKGTFDHLVPVVGDGRYVYFWSSPEDATPGPIARYGLRGRGKAMTRTIPSLAALGAGEGRWAFARAYHTFDCARAPTWYPARRIAFAGDGTGFCRGGIWVVNADGRGLKQLTRSGREPDWSVSGALVYEDRGSVKVLLPPNPPRVVIEHGAAPAWSPDGTQIAFVRGGDVLVARSDGIGQRVVVSGGADPDWSPDGTQLVYSRTSAAHPGLGIVGVDGSGNRSLTTGVDSEPAWSPNGQRIAYTHCSGAHNSCPRDVPQIAEIAPNGSGARIRTDESDETSDFAPTWGPRSELAFARARDWQDEGDAHIFTLSRRLTQTPRPRTPVVVRSAAGKTLARLQPAGEVIQLAVSRRVVAALVRGSATRRLEVLAPRKRTITLGGRTVSSISAAGSRIVLLLDRRTIAVYDTRTGRLRRVATASSRPIGLSIVGRRIAWAENVGRGARIRALTLPF